MPSTTQVEWLNENSLRAYPFAENSTRIPNDPYAAGTLLPAEYALPNFLLVDAILVVPYSSGTPSLYVSSVSLAGGVVTVVLSSDSSGSTEIAGSVAVSTSAGRNVQARFSGSGSFDGATGAVVFGDLERFGRTYPDGIFSFSPSQTRLESRCVRPSAACVSGIRVSDQAGSWSTVPLRGEVALVAGSNIRLSYMPSVNGIRIDADSNSDYNEKCDCDGSESTVRTINGISLSDVTIEGGDCVSVETSMGRIVISDNCSKPCCGCEELNFVNMKANELVTSVSRLSSFVGLLESRLDDFKTNFLDSERSPIGAL